jgi:cytochrome c-type biogenesis protein CcmH/NrfF
LLTGIGMLVYQMRKRRDSVPEVQLSAEAQQRANALLNDEKTH